MSYDKSTNYLYIGTKLPSLNEYVYKCRTNPHVGAKFKEQTENDISMFIHACISQGHLHPILTPCEIVMDFYEMTMRRDVDNVISAQKYILDALQTAGILPNDNRKWVKQIHHRVLPSKGRADCVYVYLIEGGHIELRYVDGEFAVDSDD